VPVGIEHRDQHDDRVLQHRHRVGIGCGRQPVEQIVGRLRRADFRSVDAAADREDNFLRGRELLRLVGRERSRICQALIRRTDLLEVPDVVRRADDRAELAVSVRRLPDVDHAHAIGARRDRLEVALDLVGAREPAIRAHAEAEERFRRRYLSGSRCRPDEQGKERNDRRTPA